MVLTGHETLKKTLKKEEEESICTDRGDERDNGLEASSENARIPSLTLKLGVPERQKTSNCATANGRR